MNKGNSLRVVVCTRDPRRVKDMSPSFAGISLYSLAEQGIEGEADMDARLVFGGNARRKAYYAHTRVRPGANLWTMAEETRVEVTPHRTAVFYSAVAVVSPLGAEDAFFGEIGGNLLASPEELSPVLEYRTRFVPAGYLLAWNELSYSVKRKISHRAQAYSQVRKYLMQQQVEELV